MKRCPKCGGSKFFVTAHVTQGWLVDDGGDFLEEVNSCVEVTHSPDDFDIWTCEKCGYNDRGGAFNVNKIKSFCLGNFDGTALFFEDEDAFFDALREKIEDAEMNGQEHFDVNIEQTEC